MKNIPAKKLIIQIVLFIIIFVLTAFVYSKVKHYFNENKVLKEIIMRLEADTRLAEVLVTGVNFDETTKKTFTTIKFLEYDIDNKPLKPKYFTFSGNVIQFQSLVIRFDDEYVRHGDKLRGKSVHLFWKVFLLNGKDTQEFTITEINTVPEGYRLDHTNNVFEKRIWTQFWSYALDNDKAKSEGIRNAQIEAPGTMFNPGHLYTIHIEHDGGLRIDSAKLSPILKGERILK